MTLDRRLGDHPWPTGRGLLLGLALLASGCVQYHPASTSAFPPQPRPLLTIAGITARIHGNGDQELARLDRAPPSQLRRAWILVYTRRAKQAMGTLNRLLYARPRPDPNTEALALFVRSRAFAALGDRHRAIEDCRGAARLAIHSEVKRRCAADLARLAPGSSARPARSRVAGQTRSVPPQVVPRRTWNAAQPVLDKLRRMRGIRRLTVHHSAILSRTGDSRTVATQILGIQGFHMGREHRWGDIGYHFLIDPAGRIWAGRSMRYQGAHAGGTNNQHNVGICLLGRFTRGGAGQSPGKAQIAGMERLIAWLRGKYSIPLRGILTHNELTGTNCPGARLQAVVDRLRRRVAAASAAAPASLPGGSR